MAGDVASRQLEVGGAIQEKHGNEWLDPGGEEMTAGFRPRCLPACPMWFDLGAAEIAPNHQRLLGCWPEAMRL
jgi:hypothetical protein